MLPVEDRRAFPVSTAAVEHELPEVGVVLAEDDWRLSEQRPSLFEDRAQRLERRQVATRAAEPGEVLERLVVVVGPSRCVRSADTRPLAARGCRPGVVDGMDGRERLAGGAPGGRSLRRRQTPDERAEQLALGELEQQRLRAGLLGARKDLGYRRTGCAERLEDPTFAPQPRERGVRLRSLPVAAQDDASAAVVRDDEVVVRARQRRPFDAADRAESGLSAERRRQILARAVDG
jgi:hypothetical protein